MVLSTIYLLLVAFAASGWGGALALTNVPSSDCGSYPMDIHFLLDASKSIRKPNFKKVVSFVSDFAKSLDIGPNKSQIGVTSFAESTFDHFWMNDYRDKPSLLTAISKIRYANKLHTNTAGGLDYVRQNAFAKKHGNRDGVMKVLIVVTDGRSAYPVKTVAAAQRIHADNIIVLAIAAGKRFNVDEMKLIATDPSRFFHVKNFRKLHNVKEDVLRKTCEVCPFWSGSDAVFVDGKCIRLFTTLLTWEQAKAACNAESSKVTLAEPKSQGTLEYVQTKTADTDTRTWLGATDSAVEGLWTWSASGDKMTLDLSLWGEGQPDNEGANENCLLMRPDRLLNDYPCGSQLPYFCQSIEVKVLPEP